MKSFKLFIYVMASLMAVSLLAGCKGGESSSSSGSEGSASASESGESTSQVSESTSGSGSDSSKGSDSIPSGHSYTITEAEFAALKAKLMNPKTLVEGNFTVDLTMGGVTFKNKIANGMLEFSMIKTYSKDGAMFPMLLWSQGVIIAFTLLVLGLFAFRYIKAFRQHEKTPLDSQE